jgi:hypothetical protein
MVSRTDDPTTPDARAEFACRLFELGSYRQAKAVVAEVLKNDPYHGMGNYVGAMLQSAEAVVRSRMAGQKGLIAEITASDGAGFVSDAHEEEAVQLEGAAAYHQQQSDLMYLIALKHWPRHHGYFDHSRRRERVLRVVINVLARRSVGRASGSGLGLQGLLPPHDGDTTPAPDLDAWVLEILRSGEPSRYAGDFGSRPNEALCWLQLYWVLDPAEYERFAREWLTRLESHYNREDLEALARSPVFLEHLRRLIPAVEERRTLLQTLERRCQSMTTFIWNCATLDMLTAEMIRSYHDGRLEEALAHAKARAGIRTDRPYLAVYDHVRILYDLSMAAWKNGRPVAAAQWLQQIVEAYPGLFKRLRGDGPKSYLKEIDWEDGEYEDSFGNKDDILFGNGYGGEDDDAEPPLLDRHIRLVLTSDRVADGDTAKFKAFLSQRGKNED